MPTQTERTATTRKRIIDVAREIFARDGYANASLAEIVASADVTTGALYHHFGGKKGLFVAVAEDLEQAILDEVATSAPSSGSPWDLLESGVISTLEICARPDIQRIVFRDAPNVVGLAEWREIEINYAFGLMRQTITQLADQGIINAPNPDLTAQILLGAIMEAAHGVASSNHKPKALQQSKDTIRAMLWSLRSA